MEETLLSRLPRELLLLLEDYTSQAIMLEIGAVDEDEITFDLLVGCGASAFRFPFLVRVVKIQNFSDGVVPPGKTISLDSSEYVDLLDLTRTPNDIRITQAAVTKPFYIFPPKQATLLMGKLRSLVEDFHRDTIRETY